MSCRSKSLKETSTRPKPRQNVRMMSLPEGELYHSSDPEYKEVVQKLVVRQAYVNKVDDRRKQKQVVQEIRQDLSAIRYEAQESFQAMHQDARRESITDTSAVEEDAYASQTLRAMQKLLQQPNNQSAKKDEK